MAETYGDSSVRLTPEENILFVNVPNEKLPAMLADPLFTKFKVNPGGSEKAAVLLMQTGGMKRQPAKLACCTS